MLGRPCVAMIVGGTDRVICRLPAMAASNSSQVEKRSARSLAHARAKIASMAGGRSGRFVTAEGNTALVCKWKSSSSVAAANGSCPIKSSKKTMPRD